MSNSPAEHRRRVAAMQAGEVRKGKYRASKKGPVRGNPAFARKGNEPKPPNRNR